MRNSTPSCQIPWANAMHKSVMKTFMLTSFILFLTLGLTTSLQGQCNCPTNLLTNAGFESGSNGWSASTEFYTGTGFQQCGSARNGFLQATSNAGWVWQEVNAIPGADYFVTVYAGTHHPGGDHRVRLSFYNSNGNFIAADTEQVNYDVDGQGGDLQLYTLQLKAPANAAKVRFEGYADSDYLKLDEVCMSVSENMDFAFTCADNKSITLHPLDNNGQSNSQITIPNSGNVFKYVVEIVYKGSYQPGNVLTVEGDGTEYYLNRVVVNGSSSNEKVWRGEINANPSTISYSNNQSTNQLQSLLVYAFRNGGDGNDISGTFTAVSGYHETENFSINIPTDDVPRDIELSIPLSEVTYDCRVLDITIQPKDNGSNSGMATEYRFVGDPHDWSPCCIEVIEIDLVGVPGDADEIFISIDSPTGSSSSCPDSGPGVQNGQSYVIAGALTVKTECEPSCDTNLACNPCDRVVTDTDNCSGGIDYQSYLTNSQGTSMSLTTAGPSTWEECEAEGTARYTGSGYFNSDLVSYDVYFSGATTTPPAGSPKGHSCLNEDETGWVYYEEICGTMTSAQHGTFQVSRRGEAFQVGEGANITSSTLEFGASGWTNISGGDGYYVSGDFNLMLNPNCNPPCDNVTDGGEIGFDQTICGSSVDPDAFVSISDPTGGTGELEIIWLRTNDVNIPIADWEIISGANALTFDEGVISQDMWYIRCARRAGCVEYVGESNILYLNFSNPTISDISVTHVSTCDGSDGVLDIDPYVSGGTELPFTVTYLFNGQTFTAGPFSDDSDNFITNLSPGIYSDIKLVDNAGCTFTWPTSVTIEGPSDVNAHAGDDVTTCEGSNVTLCATGGDFYSWSTGETTQCINVVVFQTTAFQVTVSNADGCSDADEVIVSTEDCCALTADAGPDQEVCEGFTTTLTAEAHNESTCEINCVTINNSYDVYLDVWEGTSGQICNDEFLSTGNSGYVDEVTFSDPIGNSNEEIVSITVTFNIAACDLESSTSYENTDNVDYDFPIQINGHTIGTFDPVELPCIFDVCEPNGIVTYTIDAASFPYNYNGNNTFDLNFLSGNQSICVANINLLIETVNVECETTSEVSYMWSTGETTQSITVGTEGNYIVTITDCSGCTATDEVYVTIGGGPTVDVGPDITICEGDQVHITSEVTDISTCGTPGESDCDHNLVDQGGYSSNTNSVQYCGDNSGVKLWTQSGQGTSYVTLDFGTTVPAGTNLCVAMKLEHCSGTGANHSDARIRGSLSSGSGFFNIDNSVTFSNSSYVCFGFEITESMRYVRIEDNGSCSFRVDYVQYTTPNTFNDNVTYAWSGPGIVGPTDGENIVVDQSGTYTLVVTDCEGCSGSDEVVVSLNDPVLADAGDNQIICSGETATLSAATVPGASYEWRDQQGNVISTNQSVDVNPIETTTYILTVTKDGCEDSDDVEVTVNDKVIDPGHIQEDQDNCGPFDPNTLTGSPATTTGDNINLSYQWQSRTQGGSWNNIPGATGLNFDPGLTSETTEFRRKAFSGNGCGNQNSNVVTITVYPIPVLDAGQDVSICDGAQITLTVNASGGTEPYTYSWPFGLGNGNSKTVGPNATTTYVVTVTDVNGCSDTDDVTVYVNPNPTAEGVDGEICAGDNDGTVSVLPTGGQEPYSYIWSNGATTQTLTNLGPASTTTYTVLVIDANECTAEASATLTVNPNPEIDLGPDQEICLGQSAEIVALTSSGTAPFSYTINGENMPDGIAEVSPTTTTSYTVVVTDAKGCTDTDEITIIVKDNPIATITGPATVCAKEDVQFVAGNAGAGATYEWTFESGTPATASGSSAIVQWMSEGEYEVKLTVTKDGCVSMATTTIIITQEVLAVAGPDESICQGGNIILNGSGTPGGTYTWTVESGDITSIDNGANSEDVLVSPLFTTEYKLVVTQNGCTRTDFVTVTIDVNKNPTADAGEDKAECEGENFILGGDPTGTPPVDDPTAPLGYSWSPAANLNDASLANPTANISTPGVYDFQVIVFSLNTGCSDTSSVTITVEEKATVGDFTFIDSNYNGVQDANEEGVNGIDVTLYDANTDQIVATTTSASNAGEDGYYQFEVCKGDYYIIFGDLDNHVRSPKDATSDNLDSDANENDGRTDDFSLVPGENNQDVDAGYSSVADLNLIKVVNDETPSVGDVVTFTITVTNEGPNNATNVEVTDEVPNGYTNINSVDGVVNGSIVTFSGLNIPTGGSVDVTLTAEVLAPSGANTSYINIAEITGSDQFDTDSTPGNGADTNSNGLIGSEDPDDSQDPLDEDDGDDAKVIPSGTISGNVSEDLDNDDVGDVGIPNVEITLENLGTGEIFTTFTDDNGDYEFVDLNPGQYKLTEQPETDIDPDYVDVFDGDETPEDGNDAVDNLDDDMILVTLESGEDDEDNNFVEEQLGSICGTVSEDIDNDDVGDIGIPGVTITLLDVDSGATTTAVTDDNGDYCFEGLEPGEYVVTEQPETDIDPDYVDVFDGDETPEDGNDAVDNLDDDTIPVTLEPGEDDEDNNFVEEQLGSICGTVSEDIDNDDVGDIGIPGVTITLLDVDSGASTTAVTDDNGDYCFEGLEPGEYVVTEQPETDIDPDYVDVFDGDETPEDGNDAVDNLDDDTIPVTLEPGEDDEDNNFVEEQLGSICGNVSEDIDNDDVGDIGIPGVTITLLDVDSGATTTAVTDDNGDYCFEGLEPGEYVVTEQPETDIDPDYVDVFDGDETPEDGNDAVDNLDDDTIPVTLEPGEDDEDNNFVEEQLGSICGNVSEDIDNDDVGDIGIPGVTITLLDVDSGASTTAVTDDNGDYCFEGLEPGEYVVTEQPETDIDPDYVDVFDGDETPEDGNDAVDNLDDDTIPVTLEPGEDDEDNNFVEEQLGSICGNVSEDIDNDDVGDIGIPGVTITLLDVDSGATTTAVTDDNGDYCFEGLEPGEYVVTEQPETDIDPDYVDVFDGDETPEDGNDAVDNLDDDTIPVTLEPGEDDEDNNFVEEQLGSICGNVSEDIDNDDVGDVGIPGVTITLLDVDSGATTTAVTDDNGDYCFEGLEPGEYVVTEQPETDIDPDYVDVFDGDETPEDGNDAVDNLDDDTIPVTLEPGEDDEDNNFVEEQLGSICGNVSEDIDNDDVGDIGIPGVTITLLDVDSGATTTAVTDDNGDYCFEGLEPGEYVVTEQPETDIDPDYVDVFDGDETPEDGNDAVDNLDDDTIPVTLEPGEDDEDNNFVEEQLGSICGNVSEDIDNDDAGDVGIPNVGVTLTDVDSGEMFNTTTDDNGDYCFEGLEPGDYKVMFQDESEIDPDFVDVFDGDETPEDGNDGVDELDDDMIAVTLEPGEDDEDNNAVEEKVASIGNYTWEDLNANGIQDDNEPPVEGIVVMLLNPDGTDVIDADGIVVASETTDANGAYLFDRLLPGEYKVKFETTAEVDGITYNVTFSNQDGNDTDDTDSVGDTGDSDLDSDADETTGESYIVNLIGGEDEEEIDAGYYVYASIGDFVWEDLDADGLQDDNEPGIPGVEVTLTGVLNDNSGTTVGPLTAITDDNGEYIFDDLIPGEYTVEFPVTTELAPGTANLTLEDVTGGNSDANDVGDDSDPNVGTGVAEAIELSSGENYDGIDAGYFAPANISHEKTFVETIPNADGTYTVVYNIEVVNEGGITGQYSLFDQPGFDNDIDIESASYTVNGGGDNALAGSGPWQLADGMSLVRDGVDVYVLTVVVSIDLQDPQGTGDNVYTECGSNSNGGDPTSGEGLFNLSQLDKDNDGDIDETDDACSDLPYIVVEKEFISATPNPDGTYDVTYNISVENIGGASGTYSLTDTPSFDDDVAINGGEYSGGLVCCGAFVDTFTGDPGTITLVTNTSLGAGLTDVFSVTFNVTLDLEEGSNDGGDNQYTSCSELTNEPGDNPEVGLYNKVKLDRNADGTDDDEDDDCGDLPYIILNKEFIGATPNANGTYTVSYSIDVENIGGATGTYSLTDTPFFDDDVTILNGGFSADQACCPGYSGDFIGETTVSLASNAEIAAGATDEYTIDFVVTIDLEEGSTDGGDNEYLPCSESSSNPNGQPGEGLYNLAELDRNSDGTNDTDSDACGDLPYVDMEKDFVGTEANGDGSYNVTYTITVTNLGGAAGTYSLTDTPLFDDDVVINFGNYSGAASGPMNTSGSTTLASGASINAGGTQVYSVVFNVTLDLQDGSNDGGDNEYTACSEQGNGPGSNPGEGLYNLAELDRGGDGTVEVEDDACGDLPYLEIEKVAGTPQAVGDGTYDITYTITVTSLGGVGTTYDLTDTPKFDDDVIINSGSYNGQNSGPMNLTSGVATQLATNESIGAGLSTHTYEVTFNVTLDLDDSIGDNEYESCAEECNPNGEEEALLNTAKLTYDGNTVEDCDCEDLPYLEIEKVAGTPQAVGDGTYDITYTITVTSLGGVGTTYDLTDTPKFDDDVIINSGSYSGQNSGPMNLTSGVATQLATNESIGAGLSTHTYEVTFNVILDLDDSIGDNEYESCSEECNPNGGEEALLNTAKLTYDGNTVEDCDCEDLPYLEIEKVAGTPQAVGDGTYDITYTITVTSLGGVGTTYDLTDTPKFDDDVIINSGSYSGQNSGPMNLTSGVATQLATNESIGAGLSTHTYEVTFNVILDLDDSIGDNEYESCSEECNPNGEEEALLNTAKLTYDGNTVEDCDCEDLPYLEIEKVAGTPQAVGDGTYDITYTITVTSLGGVGTTYDLTDTPKFDDDVIINSGSYNGQNSGPMNLTSGVATQLATNESIGAGLSTHTYEVTFNVILDLDDSIGDNEYESCAEECNPNGEEEALLNTAKLTYDGNTVEDCDCEDLPYLEIEKVAGTPQAVGDGTYDITYTITVTSLGGVGTTYDLTDTPKFDDDVIINSGSYSGQNSGPMNLTSGVATQLATNESIGAGLSTHTYEVTFNVILDLDDSIGDNEYESCSEECNPNGGEEALLNTAKLTYDGNTLEDCDCEDLPYLEIEKVAGTPQAVGDGTYDITYTITVTSLGGVGTTYDLTDTPKFDDDVIINSGSYSGQNSGPMNLTSGVATQLATNESIGAGLSTHTYEVTFNVILDLDDSIGDNEYESCAEECNPNGEEEALLNTAKLTYDGNTVEDCDCEDLPYLEIEKVAGTPQAVGDGTYDITYTITVTSLGGVGTTYDLTDTPKFDDDVIINSGSYSGQNSGPMNLTSGVATQLATNESIGAGLSTHTYEVTFNVILDLDDSIGDNEYIACAEECDPRGNNEALLNTARLTYDGNILEDCDCEDLPYLEVEKIASDPVSLPDGTYDITYTITVTSLGGVGTTYDLTDTPKFDDDVIINSGSYSGQNSGPMNLTSGVATQLATNESIGAGLSTHTYEVTFNVILDLDDSIGDNEYESCSEECNPNGGEEALLNTAKLTYDGNTVEDCDCEDLPFIIVNKEFISATPNVDGTYDVTYNIEVTNIGGATGSYTLTDTPKFDDDITINGGEFSGGLVCCGAFIDTFSGDPGTITLITDTSLDPGLTDVFSITFNVTLDLEEGSDDGGDNEYTSCSESTSNPDGTPGEGLYNLVELDRNADGTNDDEDEACGDLPYIVLDKEFVSAVQLADGTYDVSYTIEVTNNGGVSGLYSLSDTPSFDDDVTINGGSYEGELNCCGPFFDSFVGDPGTIQLVNGASLGAGLTDVVNITFNVTLDLGEDSNDGGDNVYTPCSEETNEPGSNPGEGLYNLAQLDRNADGTDDIEDDACGDLPASLGNYVWEDVNGNGAQDEGPESGIPGVEVELTGTTDDGQAVMETTTTGPDGFYLFNNLEPGDYKVTFPTEITLSGAAAQLTREDVTGDVDDATDTDDDSDPNQDNGMTETVNLDYAEFDPRLDAGYYVPGTISGFVLEDTDNDDEGEEPIEGITIELIDNFNGQVVGTATTDENGFYEFTDLPPGDYKLNQVNEPGANWQDVTDFDMSVNANDPDGDDGFAPNDMIPVILLSGEDDENNDFIEERLVAIGDYVWLDNDADGIQDDDEEGIEGVTVNLLDADGNIIDTQTTDESGEYWFDGLEPGTYEIEFVAPEGFDTSPQNINGGDADDFGDDSDADPITGLSGEVELTNGEEERDIDAGFYEPASLGDQVWLDSDGDGINDDDEEGIEGITVILLDGNGNPTGRTDVTDEDGFYLFDDLRPGEYQVEFVVPAGSELTLQDVVGPGVDDTNDSDANPDTGLSQVVTLSSGEENLTVDAGIYELLSLGDQVWIDTDNDGRFDAGENGVPFVDLALWLDLNNDDSPDINTGRTALTDFDGNYLFENLPPGDYIVQVVPSNFLPGGELVGYTSSTGNGEPTDPDDDVNNDDDGRDLGIGIGVTSKTISLRSVDEPVDDGDMDPNSNLTVDFGFFIYAAIGDYVWLDSDADGRQDDNEEGINDIVVNLYDADSGGAPIRTTLTGENPNDATRQGYYLFDSLSPGNYYVEFEIPEGFIVTLPNAAPDNLDSNIDGSNGPGTTPTISLQSGDVDLTIDAGVYQTAKVGNYVWLDDCAMSNKNVQDGSDLGLNDIVVNLYTEDNMVTPYATTLTSNDSLGQPGYYLFENLPAGLYKVEFINPNPEDWTFVVPNVGNDMIDSDVVDFFMGRTLTFEVFPGDCIEDIDAGLSQKFASIGDFVWVDSGSEGIEDLQDPTDIGLNGVVVNLYSTSDLLNPIATTTTADDGEGNPGFYGFDNLADGSYVVEFEKPTSTPFQDWAYILKSGMDDTIDSDIIDLSGRTGVIHLGVGVCNDDIDAGLRVTLPVTWLYIKGEWNQERDVNEISWATATEVNSDYYIVERSYENEGFEEIGKVDAEGNTVNVTEYAFDDINIERNGAYYYRLRQVDIDGSFGYSDIVVVNVDRRGEFTADVYPNPAYRNLNINIETSETIAVQAAILDVTGKLVMNNVINRDLDPGTTEIRVPLDALSAGTYIVRIVAGEEVINKKVLVLNR